MWTINVCELAICLRSFVQQHVGNLWQMHEWAPAFCACTGHKTGMVKSTILFYITWLQFRSTVHSKLGGYCRKRYCSISHKSKRAQHSLLLHSPSMIFPTLYEIPSEILSVVTHSCCTLSTQPNSHVNVISLWIPFSYYIQKQWQTDSKTSEGR